MSFLSGNKLPTSKEEITALLMVSALAGIAALARVLYGKEELRWRYTVGSLLIAMATAVVVYSMMLSVLGELGGQASAGIGAAVGIFTDDAMRRVKSYLDRYKLPGEEEEK
jgi:drug/metabolite transporter (DMT)-like permease